MSGLTEAERQALAAAYHVRQEFEYGDCDHGTYSGGPSHGKPYAMCERWAGPHTILTEVIEATIDRAVREALEDAAELIGQFDPTDKYHGSDYQEPGYYSALSRAEALLLGHISDWRDQGPSARAT